MLVSAAEAKRHRLKSRVVTTRTLRLAPGSKKVTLKVSRKLRNVRATIEVRLSDGTKLTKRVRIGS